MQVSWNFLPSLGLMPWTEQIELNHLQTGLGVILHSTFMVKKRLPIACGALPKRRNRWQIVLHTRWWYLRDIGSDWIVVFLWLMIDGYWWLVLHDGPMVNGRQDTHEQRAKCPRNGCSTDGGLRDVAPSCAAGDRAGSWELRRRRHRIFCHNRGTKAWQIGSFGQLFQLEC